MFMNLTIHDTKRFTIHNISIHYLYLDSTTMVYGPRSYMGTQPEESSL